MLGDQEVTHPPYGLYLYLLLIIIIIIEVTGSIRGRTALRGSPASIKTNETKQNETTNEYDFSGGSKPAAILGVGLPKE